MIHRKPTSFEVGFFFCAGIPSTEGPGWIKHVIARSKATWQSASPAVQSTARPLWGRKRTDCHVGLCPPRNDAVILTRSFCCQCGSGHPGRGVPTVFTVGNGLRAVPQNARKRPPHSGESARSPRSVIARSEATWQSASPAVQSTARPQRGRKRTDCQQGNCPEGAREATLGCVGLWPPRNDAVILTRSFC